MEKMRYMISDAANLVHVEAHVLRYWEEELGLTVPRNEMGHRYYTRDNIQEFMKIKELKEEGYQLRTIRMLLHHDTSETVHTEEEKKPSVATPMQAGTPHAAMERSAEDRMEEFRELMCEIVGHAIALNNEELSQSIGQEVGEQVLKEINYLAREQEEAQEERYRKLDEAIRKRVRSRRFSYAGEEAGNTKREERKLQKQLRKEAKKEMAARKRDAKANPSAAMSS